MTAAVTLSSDGLSAAREAGKGLPLEALLAKYNARVPRYTSYPTAPHFHAGVDGEVYRRWLAELPRETPLSLYLHIPFCDSLCWFCGCHTKIVNRYQPICRYLEGLEQEIDLVAEMLGPGRPVNHVHWGGGTPTILAPDDIERLAALLGQRFERTAESEFAVEIDPRELTDARIAALAAAGVTRASLGVQDVNPETQAAVNRIQPFEVTRNAVEGLRARGIEDINIDLMYGLPFQTVARVEASVAAVLALEPQRVALFGYAHVPWMKRHQKLIREETLPGAKERLAQMDAAARRLEAEGYVAIGLDHFAHRDDPLAIAARRGALRRNFQGYTTDTAGALIAFGASGIGSLPQGYVQNQPDIAAYRRTVLGGGLATVRGIAVDDEDRLRRAVIERLMCDLEIDLAALCTAFGIAMEHFAAELERLRELAGDGIVVVEGGRITVPVSARPLIRAVCAVFDTYLTPVETRHVQAV